MKNLISCIGKDLRIFGRSRFSAFITVIIPLIIVLLVGTAFSSNSLQGIKVGTYSESYSELSESMLKNFEEQSFIVIKSNSKESCINSVKAGEVQLCIIFPADLSEKGNEESIEFHVDESRINLAYLLIDDLKGSISARSSEIGLELVGDLISDLDTIKNELAEQQKEITSATEGVSDIQSGTSELSSSVPDVGNLLAKLR